MATTVLMLQLEVEQQLSTDVSSINEIFAEAATFLNGGTVTVTEIAVQKLGGVFGNNIAIRSMTRQPAMPRCACLPGVKTR
jgi:hypothetical protein